MDRTGVTYGALALVLLLAGCSSSSSTAVKTSPHPSGATGAASLDAGWTLHSDYGAGAAVAVPDAWALAMADSPTLTQDLAAISAIDTDIGTYFTNSLTVRKTPGLAILAADPRTVPSGFTTNALVFRIDLGPAAQAPSLDAISQGKLRVLNKDSTISGTIDRRRVSFAGRDADRLGYIFKSGAKSVEVASYLLTVEAGGHRIEYELTIGSATADYSQLFDKIAASFALVSGHAPTPKPAATPSPAVKPTASA